MRPPAQFKKGLLVAMDPGVHQGGLAVLEDSVLIGAGAFVSTGDVKRGHVAWNRTAAAVRDTYQALTGFGADSQPSWLVTEQMVIRKPQAQRGSKKNVDPMDLMEVAYSSVYCAMALGGVSFFYKPEDVKGQLKKDVAWNRCMDTLTPEELRVIRSANQDLTEDIHDAIYIGLWAVGRVGGR